VNGSSQASKEPQLHNTNYKLYGVLVHLGYTSHSGHYYSYVRAPNDVWYKADDERVSVVSKNDALNQNAYILFYSRIINEGLSGNEPMPTSTTAANGAHSPTQTNSPLLSNGHSTTNGNHHFNPNTTKLNIPHVIKTESLSAPKKTCSNYLNSLNTTTTLSNSQKIIFKIKSSISQSVSSQKAMPYSLVNNRPNSTLGCSISPNGKVVPLVTNGATNGMAIGALSNGTTLMKAQNGYHSLSSSSTSSLSSSNSTSSLIKSSTSQNESKTRDESPLLKLLVNGNGYHSNETSKQEKSKKSSTTDSSEKKKKKKKKFKRLKQKILKGKYSKSIKKKIKALKNKRDRRKLKKLAKKLGLVDKKKDSKHNHKNQHEQSSNSNSP
jgi:ubiquitin carboxyl-terminal hydrolase 36/42